MELSDSLLKRLAIIQRSEITGHHIYKRIAALLPDEANRSVIRQLAADEMGHHQTWKKYTNKDVSPNWLQVWFFVLLARILGFTFAIKLMEQGEEQAQLSYSELAGSIPEVTGILAVEEEHETKLLGMLDEERLHYVGSVILGLNDALVELTGALAGLTLAFQNTQLIALSGLITGISASVSMAASEYLSTRSEQTDKNPVRASIYTGIAYIITVTLLILPYLLLKNYLLCLAICLVTAVVIIAAFNYYVSVAKGENFRRRFIEMAGVSLGVALFSFVVGYLIRQWLGVDI
jgi:VIT1/CCC1 family predicted Fe2+/Mn2+ transporter